MKEIKESKMWINIKLVITIVSFLITISSIVYAAGKLNQKIDNSEIKINDLRTLLDTKELNLKKDLDTKVSLELFNIYQQNIKTTLELYTTQNEKDHNEIKKSMEKMDLKLDKILDKK